MNAVVNVQAVIQASYALCIAVSRERRDLQKEHKAHC